MRLSEKTIEINICAQINQYMRSRIIWFGLTQAQEAIAGFDTAARLGGKILLFQFKASNHLLRSGERRFHLKHDQLQNLINRLKGCRRSIFYVFPSIGNTYELAKNNGDLISSTKLLDVSNLPNPFPPPITMTKPYRIRKNNTHYADVLNNRVTIHSEPVKADLLSFAHLAETRFKGSDGINSLILREDLNFERALELLQAFRKDFKMAVLI